MDKLHAAKKIYKLLLHGPFACTTLWTGGKGIHFIGGYNTSTSNTLDKKDGGNVTTQEVGTYLVYHCYLAESCQQSHFNS